MQATAVLLLEMAYESVHIKDEKDTIVSSIKKMIRWLRAMQSNDPVAGRAYNVVWTILKNCSPALQSQANELLAVDAETPQESHSHSHHQQNHLAEQQQTYQWLSGQPTFSSPEQQSLFNTQFMPQQPMTAFPEYDFSSLPFDSSQQFQTHMTFGNPFFTNFDQGVPVVNMRDLWMSQPSMGYSDMTFQQQQPMPHPTVPHPTMTQELSQDFQEDATEQNAGPAYPASQQHHTQPW